MGSAFWEDVVAGGRDVPEDRPLDEVTAELTGMLGSADPGERDRCATTLLGTWIGRGVYDDLLTGLGDGMAAGLDVGLGEQGGDTVFRRSSSAGLLGVCIERDNSQGLLAPSRILTWGDRLAAWFVRERDLRGHIEGKGWAAALARGADALGALGASHALARPELTVLLDVIADRMLLPGEVLLGREPDCLAAATIRILRRDQIPLSVLEPWVSRLGAGAQPPAGEGPVEPAAINTRAFLRALYLHLAVGVAPEGTSHPAIRPDLLLVLVEALRALEPTLRPPR